jgi:CheY-like chemotaxis protein
MFTMEMIRKHAPAISILVVEEDDLSREILATIIPKRFPHAVVYSAANCNAGLDLMETHQPDIVITDIIVPGMDGIRTADHIPSVKPGTKLIVITADSERPARKDAALSSITVDHYLFKPVHCPDLFAAIEQCIAEVAGGRV